MMGDVVYGDLTYFRNGVCNKLISVGEDGVYTNRVVGVHYTHGKVFTM